jgi:hypothetical protein
LRVTIDGAIQEVLGISGNALYAEWMDAARKEYANVARNILANERKGSLIEPEGFGNAFPVFIPGGQRIAYISNKGQDYFGVSAINIRSLTGDSLVELSQRVRSPIAISQDANTLMYARIDSDNPFRSSYSDLYRYDVKEDKEDRITNDLRASAPAITSDGTTLAFVVNSDGTTNLATSASNGTNVKRLTEFREGEQVFSPAWSPDGKEIAFAFAKGHRQSLGLINVDGTGMRFIPLAGDARNPAYSPDGRFLYYSWDTTGVFNIYRMDRESGIIDQVTNVIGGAFQPTLSSDGKLAYSLYTATGFKIALLDTIQPIRSIRDLVQFSNIIPENDAPPATPDTAAARPYRSRFTSISFIPVLRFDNYNERASLVDLIKPGLYIASFEMLDKLNLFAGGAVNRKWERDVFASVEYRDRLPGFVQLGLSPTLTAEIYSISRNATTSFDLFITQPHWVTTDVTYDLLEFDFSILHPIFNEQTILRTRYSTSRYNATLEYFTIQDPGLARGFAEYPAVRFTYLTNNIFSARIKHSAIVPTVDRDINPIGREIALEYAYEMNKYNAEGDYEISSEGSLLPVYKRFDFHRWQLSWNEHLPFFGKKQTLSFGFQGGTIQGMTADTIFHFYAGGFVGMKGYPFYAIEGNHLAMMNLTYRFPIWSKINTRILQMYFTKLYGSVFADIGNAWNGQVPGLDTWKTDAGLELRLEAFSFYAFPTRIFLAGAYGFDKFDRNIRGNTITYGKEWRFYLGVLFGFELTDISQRLYRR